MEVSNIKFEVKVISKRDFPQKLLNIKSVPEKLYTIGNIELLYKDSLGIVGTRKNTEYGKRMCEKFSRKIALSKIPIVSGMALGIDEIAHRSCLNVFGDTIAVLGSGFKNIYPKENTDLFFRIIENNGLIISEYDLDEEASPDKFPKRNRIISALSEGILVVEAPKRSGSLITANITLELNKNVFVIPGRITDIRSMGNISLIKKGAKVVVSPEEILEYYPQFVNKMCIEDEKKIIEDNDSYKQIYNLLTERSLSIDEINLEMKMDIRKLSNLLTQMELEGKIKSTVSGYEIAN